MKLPLIWSSTKIFTAFKRKLLLMKLLLVGLQHQRVSIKIFPSSWNYDFSVIEEKDRLVQEYYHNLMSQTRQGKGGVHPIVLMVDTAPTSGKVDIKGFNLINKIDLNIFFYSLHSFDN